MESLRLVVAAFAVCMGSVEEAARSSMDSIYIIHINTRVGLIVGFGGKKRRSGKGGGEGEYLSSDALHHALH